MEWEAPTIPAGGAIMPCWCNQMEPELPVCPSSSPSLELNRETLVQGWEPLVRVNLIQLPGQVGCGINPVYKWGHPRLRESGNIAKIICSRDSDIQSFWLQMGTASLCPVTPLLGFWNRTFSVTPGMGWRSQCLLFKKRLWTELSGGWWGRQIYVKDSTRLTYW